MCVAFSDSETVNVRVPLPVPLFVGDDTMPGIDFALLRGQVPLAQVLDLVGFRALTRVGWQLRGACPVHGSTSPGSRSFAAHLAKQCWQCFRCGAGGNALDLYAAVTKLPLYAAAVELCARLHLPVPWRTASASRSPP